MGKKIRIIGPKIDYQEIYSGYTYFMKCKHSSVVKIGFSKNPAKRLRDLKLSGSNYSAYDFKILFVINTNIEKLAHRTLKVSPGRETYEFHGISPLDFGKWLIKPRGRWWDMEVFNREANEMRLKISHVR